MNKLIKVVFLLMLSISTFSIGIFCGSKLNRDNQKNVIEEVNKSTDIALINLDEGIEIDGKKIHYAQNMLNLPGDNFKFTSLNEAKLGLENGMYAAYILLPTTFSSSIESINEKPVKVELEYELSDNLDPDLKTDVVKNIEDFKSKLNSDISYLYVSAVMEEFHNAQDNSAVVLKNDEAELEEMSAVKVRDIISSIEFPEVEFVEFIRSRLDIAPVLSANLELIDAMKDNLQERIQMGRDDYESVSKDRDLLSEGSREFLDILGGLDIELDDNGEPVYKSGVDKLATQVNKYNADIHNNRNFITAELASNSNAARRDNQEYIDSNLRDIKNSWQNSINETLSAAEQNIEQLISRGLENLLAMQERIYDELDVYVRHEFEAALEHYNQEAGREIESYKENLISELVREGYIDEDENDPIYAIIASSSNAEVRLATYSNAESFTLRDAGVDFIDRESLTSPMLGITDTLENTSSERPAGLFNIPDISFLLSEAVIALPENAGDWYRGFLESVERMYLISTTDIENTVKNEIVGAIKTKSSVKYSDLKNVMNKLNTAFDDYQNSLYQFDPYSHIDVRVLEQSASKINSNVQDIASKSAEYAGEQNEEVSKVREQESKHTQALRDNMNTSNKNTEELVTKTLDTIKDKRKSNTNENKTLLEDFNTKLPYTKVGSVANKEVFDFMAAPVKSNEIKKVRLSNFIKTEYPYEKGSMYVLIVSGIMTLGAGGYLGIMRLRRRRDG